jgi:hypothetical protein
MRVASNVSRSNMLRVFSRVLWENLHANGQFRSSATIPSWILAVRITYFSASLVSKLRIDTRYLQSWCWYSGYTLAMV